EDQQALQRSILLGRSVGVGEPFSREVVRGAMLLRLTGFLSGDAGVTSDLCGLLAERLNDGWTPYVPTGPHGSAGEVIPLAHLFQTLVGEGFVLEDGERVPAAEALAALLGGDWTDGPQAPVSLRVAPQVHGAVLDVLDGVERQLERELRAVTDSPLYLPAEDGEPEGFYPTGNFHSQALAFGLDALAIAFA